MKKSIVLFLLFVVFSGYSQTVQDSSYFKITPLKHDWSKLDASSIIFSFDKKYFKDISVVSVYDLNSIFKYDYIHNQGNFTSRRVTANPDGGFLALDRDFYHPTSGESLAGAFMVGLFNTIFK